VRQTHYFVATLTLAPGFAAVAFFVEFVLFGYQIKWVQIPLLPRQVRTIIPIILEITIQETTPCIFHRFICNVQTVESL
jgi:hypothetical protein